VSAMQISQEGAKDFLKKVVESIKAIFRKVMNAAKKLYVKLVVAMNGTAKKAQKLQKYLDKDLKDATAEKSKFEEKESEKLRKLTIAVDGSNANIFKISDHEKVLAAMGKLVDVRKKYIDDVEALDSNADDFTTKKSALSGALGTDMDNALTSLEILDKDSLESKTNYSASEDKVKVAATSTNGKVLRVIEVSFDDDTVNLKAKTLTVDTSDVSTDKMDVKDKTAVVNELKQIVTDAKGFGKVKDSAMKFIEKSNKELDKTASKSAEGKFGYVINKLKAGQATMLRDLAVTAALNSVLDNVKLTKAKFHVLSRHAAMYSNKKAEM